MDIVNEIYDTFIGDYMWAWLLPAKPAPYEFPNPTNGSEQVFTSWQYVPSTKYFSITPGEAAYLSEWTRDNMYRQAVNIFFILWIFGALVYFICASLSYMFIFDMETKNHPKYLKNQISMEIKQANVALPWMAVMTVPFVIAELQGYSKLYDTSADGPGRWYDFFQFPLFLLCTDFAIYWVHRGLHHPLVYKTLHKPHHKWIMPTPYASHAFHPVDGFAQSLPYHVFPFIFPLQKVVYVLLFVFINLWTVVIHDGEYAVNSAIINGAACHTYHHLYFNYNYGQYTTIWDRLGGSYRRPSREMFIKSEKKSDAMIQAQVEEMEKLIEEVEGVDDRTYGAVDTKKNI
ncbi:putative C-5 sterol desaturase [Xylariales sp. PMI_506]|nr:putative C-5 sterol desaturase [Xylariales sp. PMI_506]